MHDFSSLANSSQLNLLNYYRVSQMALWLQQNNSTQPLFRIS